MAGEKTNRRDFFKGLFLGAAGSAILYRIIPDKNPTRLYEDGTIFGWVALKREEVEKLLGFGNDEILFDKASGQGFYTSLDKIVQTAPSVLAHAISDGREKRRDLSMSDIHILEYNRLHQVVNVYDYNGKKLLRG